jgi:hypothetical protein
MSMTVWTAVGVWTNMVAFMPMEMAYAEAARRTLLGSRIKEASSRIIVAAVNTSVLCKHPINQRPLAIAKFAVREIAVCTNNQAGSTIFSGTNITHDLRCSTF